MELNHTHYLVISLMHSWGHSVAVPLFCNDVILTKVSIQYLPDSSGFRIECGMTYFCISEGV